MKFTYFSLTVIIFSTAHLGNTCRSLQVLTLNSYFNDSYEIDFSKNKVISFSGASN